MTHCSAWAIFPPQADGQEPVCCVGLCVAWVCVLRGREFKRVHECDLFVLGSIKDKCFSICPFPVYNSCKNNSTKIKV